jgi:hypothetical protein
MRAHGRGWVRGVGLGALCGWRGVRVGAGGRGVVCECTGLGARGCVWARRRGCVCPGLGAGWRGFCPAWAVAGAGSCVAGRERVRWCVSPGR